MSNAEFPTHLPIDLLASEPAFLNSHQILLLGSAHGLFANYLSGLAPNSHIWATDTTASSLISTIDSGRAKDVLNVQCFPELKNPDSYLLDPPSGPFDAAVIILPKGRKAARRWLLQAHRCLHDSGILYLAGANDAGIQSVAKDATELFGQANVLGYKKGNRVYRCGKTKSQTAQPEWTQQPGIKPGTWNEYKVGIREREFIIHTLPGVFSFDHVDEGTAMLLDCMHVPCDSRVLDLGCGCGLIGMVAAHLGAGHVDLTDDHLLSVSSTLENIRLNHIHTATVYAGDLFGSLPEVKYDAIFSNPPFHAGKEVNYQVAQALITSSHHYLIPGGYLVIVANRFIRYERLMVQIFHNVQVIAENNKFHVLSSQKA